MNFSDCLSVTISPSSTITVASGETQTFTCHGTCTGSARASLIRKQEGQQSYIDQGPRIMTESDNGARFYCQGPGAESSRTRVNVTCNLLQSSHAIVNRC